MRGSTVLTLLFMLFLGLIIAIIVSYLAVSRGFKNQNKIWLKVPKNHKHKTYKASYKK